MLGICQVVMPVKTQRASQQTKKPEELIQSSMAQYRGGGQAFPKKAPSSGRISAAQRRTGKRLQSQAGITKKV
jgi:hypothetical protein